MNRILNNFTNRIIHRLNPGEEEKEIISYGVHQLIIIVANILAVIVFGILWEKLFCVMVFFVTFIILRPYTGGYHADTELRCYMISLIVINIILAVRRFLLISNGIYIIIDIIGICVIWWLSPVENTNNTLEKDEIIKYRKKSHVISGIILLLIIISNIIYIPDVYMGLSYTVVFVALLLLAGKIKYKYFKSYCECERK